MVTRGAVIKLIYNLMSGSSLTFYRVIKSHGESSTQCFGNQHPLRLFPIYTLSSSPCPLSHRARMVLSRSPGNTS